MSATNVKLRSDPVVTHEGAVASRVSPIRDLRQAILGCLLFEDQHYESGQTIADRIKELVPKCKAAEVAALAIQARSAFNIRHASLFLARELVRHPDRKSINVAKTITDVIQRADEIAEFLSIYWLDNKDAPLASAVKRGLAAAFHKFNAYGLSKYNQDKAIKLRDVAFLVHPKPDDADRATIWQRLFNKTSYSKKYGGQFADDFKPLESPDTWEVAISATGGKNKAEEWTRLLREGKIGYMALLRNLRNMTTAGVDHSLVAEAIIARKGGAERLFPFRYVAAAKAAPKYEPEIDRAFLDHLSQSPKLIGKTVGIIDVSGSMYGSTMSANSDMDRAHAACALGAILRELCERPAIYATAGDDDRHIHATKEIPARRGMSLVDAIYVMTRPLGGGGIFLKQVMDFIATRESGIDRVIVITDEADCGMSPEDSPLRAKALGRYNYVINVSSYAHSIVCGGGWTRISGFSEAVIEYIRAAETMDQQ